MGNRGRGDRASQRRRRNAREARRKRLLYAELVRPEREEIEVRAVAYQTSLERRTRRAAAVVLGGMGLGTVLAILAALGVL